MNLEIKFAVWCAKKCLPLWDPPKAVLIWLDDPENKEKADKARLIASMQITEATSPASAAVAATVRAAKAVAETEQESFTVVIWTAISASGWAAVALKVSTVDLRKEFVSTWTDEELKTTNPDWIEYATIEIFAR